MFSKRAVLSQFRPPVTSLGLQYVRRSFKASSGTSLCFHLHGVKQVYILQSLQAIEDWCAILNCCELGSMNYRALALSGQSL